MLREDASLKCPKRWKTMNFIHFNNIRLLRPLFVFCFKNDHVRLRPSHDNLQNAAPNSNVLLVLDNHKSVLTTFGIQTADEELDLPYIYWIPKMHKNPYTHRFIAGSSKCSTKPLSILLTKLLTHIKQGLQKYCETAYSRSGVNQMWILRKSKELSINYHFQTLRPVLNFLLKTYTTINLINK